MSSEEKEQKRISRREFVKGAAVGAAGVAAAGALASCTTAATPEVVTKEVVVEKEVPVTVEVEKQVIVEKEVPVEVIKEVVVNPLIPQKWDYEADVVVVGLGGAGASAAIEAHDNGAKVLVLEKQPYGEGEWAGYTHFSNSRMCGGVFHSPHPDGDREAMLRYVNHMFNGEHLPWKLEGEQPHVADEIVRMYVDEIYKLPGWLLSIDPDLDEERLAAGGDAAFYMFPDFEEAKYGSTRSIRYKDRQLSEVDRTLPQPKTHKSSGEAWMWCLVEEGIRKQRPEITLLYSTPGKRLVQRANGEIIGVIAEREGKEIACKAKKAVILTAGGYEYSVAMRRAFLKGPGVKGWGFYGSPDNRGEGIAMAIEIGAGLAKVMKAASRMEPAVQAGRVWDETGLRQGLTQTYRNAGNFVVDNYGQRFINERLATSGAYRYQSYEVMVTYEFLAMCYSRVPAWHITDEKSREARRLVGGVSLSPNPRFAIPWDRDNLDAIARGWVLKGDTIEELAAKIKAHPENRNMMDAETLAETVSKWNDYSASGKDLEFDRRADDLSPVDTPPFYALPVYAGGPNTKGGIDADATRHVLDWEGEHIPRLYTAGEMSSVFKFVYQAGGNVTECMVCGRVAGRNAAAETPWS